MARTQQRHHAPPARHGAGRGGGISHHAGQRAPLAPATHRQALNAILLLYRQVLDQDLPWLQATGRPPERKRIPAVLTQAEVQSVLALLDGVEGLLARLLYGTGMRPAEPWT